MGYTITLEITCFFKVAPEFYTEASALQAVGPGLFWEQTRRVQGRRGDIFS